jgi:hypothetical protein
LGPAGTESKTHASVSHGSAGKRAEGYFFYKTRKNQTGVCGTEFEIASLRFNHGASRNSFADPAEREWGGKVPES